MSRSKFPVKSFRIAAAVSAACALLLANAARAEEIRSRQFDIDAQTLSAALSEFARQSQQEILFTPEVVAKKHSSGVRGTLNPIDALAVILKDTGLTFATTPQGAILVQPEKTSQTAGWSKIRVAQVDQEESDARAAESTDEAHEAASASSNATTGGPQSVALKVPEVLVVGSRMLNMDIRRSRDDPQPYVIFSRETIEQSGAVDVNDFLKTRLTMNTAGGSNGQMGSVGGKTSGVNLRGLGENQTLILIDGRRSAKTSTGFSPGQPDLNGIPLAAIERIEVLPTTASAIYGGAATGGVVNIILRRDYTGAEVTVTYDNSFDTDSGSRRIDFASGYNFFEGKTNVLVAGSYSDSNQLLVKELDFLQRGRAQIVANNPNWMAQRSFPLSGATANVYSSNGSNLVLDNGTPLNARFTSSPVGYAGSASDGGVALLANAGQYNLDLSDGAAFGGAQGNSSIVPAARIKSLSGTVRHEFSSQLHGFLEASHAENISRSISSETFYAAGIPANSPTNPFQQAITVVAPTEQFNGTRESESIYDRYGAGLIYKLPHNWTISADYTFTEAELGYVETAAFGPALAAAAANGSIDMLQDVDAFGVDLSIYASGLSAIGEPVTSTTKNPALRLSGPIGSWKAGSPQLSLLLEQQDIKYGTGAQIVLGGTYEAFFPERTQKIDSAYVELRIPLLSAANEVPWVKELELQLATRWDRYKSKNANYVAHYLSDPRPNPIYIENSVEDTNPLVALRYRPIDSLTLRASYGTGFIPPEINQLTASLASQSSGSYIDPRRGNTGLVAPYLLTTGGNSNIQPESSTSWSAGLIFTPQFIDGLRVSLDYTNIEKEDNISSLSEQQLLDNEQYFPGRITRGPNLPGDQPGWAGPITAINRTLINSAWAKLETYDLQLDYGLPEFSFGNVAVFALATWQPTFDTQLAASLPVLDQAGIATLSAIPVEFKANAGITWTHDRWAAGWNTRYIDSYYVANPTAASSALTFLNQGNGGKVEKQIYHDVFAKFGFNGNGSSGIQRVLGGLEVQAGVRNVFNKRPPYDVGNGFTYYSWLGDPRLATYYITLKQSF